MKILSSLRDLLHPAPTTRTPARRFSSRIEPLEARIAPANNVVTSLVGGTLTITTVDQLGEAEVLAGDNAQEFELLGLGTGNVTVHKSGFTTIDGGAADVPFTGVTNIVIDLKLGNDEVTTKALDLAGDLTFKGGDGNNTLVLDANATNTKLRNLSVTNGDGDDVIRIFNGATTIAGKLTIKSGEGDSSVRLGEMATDDLTLVGAVSITGGTVSSDVFAMGDAFLAQSSITIKGGKGNNDLFFGGHTFEAQGPVTITGGNVGNSLVFDYDTSLVLAQALSVKNGPGFDTFRVGNGLNQSSSFASITINNGSGGSETVFDSVTTDAINGNLTIINGAGNDTFTADPNDFSVTGMFKISNGAGDSTTDISPTNSNTVGGAFSLANAAGTDTTTIGGNVVGYKAATISNGVGDSTTTLTGSNLSFASLSSTSADGMDLFTVNAGNLFEIVTGGLSIKNGVGGSTTTIGSTGTAAIAGTLSVTNGDGRDEQFIGTGAGNFSGLHGVTISNGPDVGSTIFNPAQLTITGSVSVTSGPGSEAMRIGDGALTSFTVTGSVKVTSVGNTGVSLTPTNAGTIAGGLSVKTVDGSDFVDLFRMTVNGASVFSLGNRNDQLRIQNSTLAAFSVTGGAGADVVSIENGGNDSIGTTINGAVNIDLGGGDDFLVLGLDADDFVTTNAALKFNGGAHLDQFLQGAAPNVFTIAPVISGFEVQTP